MVHHNHHDHQLGRRHNHHYHQSTNRFRILQFFFYALTMAAARAWEERARRREPLDDQLGDWGECTDSDDEDAPVEPADELVRELLGLLMYGTLSAHKFCVLMFWLKEMGVKQAKPYAVRPGSNSGAYNRRIRRALGWDTRRDWYELDVPGHSRHDLQRTLHTVPVIPFQEQLERQFTADSDFCKSRLMEMRREDKLPPRYWRHPVVQEHPQELVLPIALYLDGVPYSQTDSVIGWWCQNLISGDRIMYGLLRKRNTCQCGCRGWCSFFQFFNFTAWGIACLGDKQHALERHDKTPWRVSDSQREAKAGGEIIIRCACLYLKGDWAEFANTCGLTQWGDGVRPCWKCNAFGIDLFLACGNSEDILRWPETTDADYDLACDACEVKIIVATLEQRKHITDALKFDKRDKGGRGRCLVRDLPAWNLRELDRLEPSVEIPDVAQFDEHPVPFRATFWRASEETATRHRNPLCSQPKYGLALSIFTIDSLHSFYLGPLNGWCRVTLWELIESNAYGIAGTEEEAVRRIILVIRSRLFAWYKRRAAEHPNEELTRLSDLAPKMVGATKLKTKAAETWGFAIFLLDELDQYGDRGPEDWQRLRLAGQCMKAIVNVWQKSPWKVPAADVSDA